MVHASPLLSTNSFPLSVYGLSQSRCPLFLSEGHPQPVPELLHQLDSPSSEVIKKELLSWKGVTTHEHNFRSIIFYVNGFEMGHLNGDAIADPQFPKKVSKKLVTEGRVLRHHVIPKSEWVSHEIQTAKDVQAVIELFRLQYQRPANMKQQK